MKPVRYTCVKCGEENTITSFWTWFWTPHLGASKYLKCKACEQRNWMSRNDGRKWLDTPKEKSE